MVEEVESHYGVKIQLALLGNQSVIRMAHAYL